MMDDFYVAMGKTFLFALMMAAIIGIPVLFFMALDWLSNLHAYAKTAADANYEAERANEKATEILRRQDRSQRSSAEWQEAVTAKLDKLQADLKEMKETIDAM